MQMEGAEFAKYLPGLEELANAKYVRHEGESVELHRIMEGEELLAKALRLDDFRHTICYEIAGHTQPEVLGCPRDRNLPRHISRNE